MTTQPDYADLSLLPAPQSLNSNNSSNFIPPLASAITPQLVIDRQDHQNDNSTLNPHLTLLVDRPSNIPRTKGFNSTDFETPPHSSLSSSIQRISSSSSASSSLQHQASPISLRQRIYQIIDSIPVTLFVFFLMAFDSCCFLTAYLYILQHQHSPLFRDIYYASDWLTAVAYLLEVNIRLYAYGPEFYFHGALRCLDYVIAVANSIFIVIYSIYPDQWLLVTRFTRTLRMVTALTTWRERKLKGRTRQQLQSLAELLDKEKSDRSKLTKWKIDPEAIAIGERAGKGGFGTVFSGLFRGTLVAVKQVSYPDHEQAPTSIEDEAITLVNLRHPNVVLFMGFVHEPSQLWIVTEYCSRGSLRDLLDDRNLKLTEGRILKLALGAARGLAYLHGQDPPVLHLDLKTSNVLISSGWDAKLGDFGLSRSIDKIEKDWFSGTMQYAAPEILEANIFSTAADIYSFGICLWEMAAREIPFQGLSPMSVLWGVVRSKLRPSLDSIKVSTKKTDAIIANDFPPNRPQSSSPERESLPANKPSGIHESSTVQDRKRLSDSAFTTLRVSREQLLSSSRSLAQKTSDSHELQNHQKLFERVEESDRTGLLVKDTVTASIVEGIVVPPSLNTIDKTNFHGTPNGYEDEEASCPSHPKKKRSVFREQNRPPRAEQFSPLSGLTSKVTETIQMFDERPPVIRRKEQEGSNDYGAQSKTESMTGSASGGQSFRARRNVLDKPSLRIPRPLSKIRSGNRLGNSGSRKEMGSKKDEEDPFVRRLASVSVRARRGENEGHNSGPQQRVSEDLSAGDISVTEGRNSGVAASATIPGAAVPKEYLDLMQKCWSHDPKNRPSAGEIVWRLVILIDSQMRDK